MTIESIDKISTARGEQVKKIIKLCAEDLRTNLCKNCRYSNEHPNEPLEVEKITNEYFGYMQNDKLLLLKNEDEIVGLIAYSKYFDKEESVENFGIYLHTLLIHPEYRRKGWGTSLLKALEDIWQSRRIITNLCGKNRSLVDFMSKNLYMMVQIDKVDTKGCYGADLFEKYTTENVFNLP